MTRTRKKSTASSTPNKPTKKTSSRVEVEAFPDRLAAYLEERGIAPETAAELGLSYATPEELKVAIGTSMEAIAIEYRTPAGETIMEHGKPFQRYRIFPSDDSFLVKAKNLPKFLQPAGTSNHLYFAPVIDWEKVITNPNVAIGITEGELKAMCACLHDVPYIGLGGVYGWMTKVDGVSVPLPDLDLVVWKGRNVELTFDNDVTSKIEVRRALGALKRELTRRGAEVTIVKLPDEGEKLGLDDYLVRYGAGKFDKLDREELKLDPIVEAMNKTHAAINVNGSLYYLSEFKERVTFSKAIDLVQQYENDAVKFTKADGTAGHKNRFEYWRAHPDRRQYADLVFRPQGCPDTQFNLWRGFTVEPRKGDCSIFLDHIRRNMANGNKEVFDYIVKWMAHAVQKPEEIPGVAIAMRGEKGTGKSLFGTVFGQLFGSAHFAHISDPQHVVGNFNSMLEGKILILADEAIFAGDHATDNKLKALITERKITINRKGMTAYSTDNYARFIIASNADHILQVANEERRYLLIEMGKGNQKDTKFFGQLLGQMENGGYEALMHHLKGIDLRQFDVKTIPETNALKEQREASLDVVSSYLVDLVDGDAFPSDGVITTARLYNGYLDAAKTFREFRPRSMTAFVMKMKKLIPGAKSWKKKISGFQQRAICFPPRIQCQAELTKSTGFDRWTDEESPVMKPKKPRSKIT